MNESTIAEFTPTPKLVWNVGTTSWRNMLVQHFIVNLHLYCDNEFDTLPSHNNLQNNFDYCDALIPIN